MHISANSNNAIKLKRHYGKCTIYSFCKSYCSHALPSQNALCGCPWGWRATARPPWTVGCHPSRRPPAPLPSPPPPQPNPSPFFCRKKNLMRNLINRKTIRPVTVDRGEMKPFCVFWLFEDGWQGQLGKVGGVNVIGAIFPLGIQLSPRWGIRAIVLWQKAARTRGRRKSGKHQGDWKKENPKRSFTAYFRNESLKAFQEISKCLPQPLPIKCLKIMAFMSRTQNPFDGGFCREAGEKKPK